MIRHFPCVGIRCCLALAMGLLAANAFAQPAGSETPESLMQLDADGLPKLYHLAAEECQRVLQSSDRWITLPRPITSVYTRSDLPPAFEMRVARREDQELRVNLAAGRKSLEKSWPSGSRVIYNNDIGEISGQDVWLLSVFPPTWQHFNGQRWTTGRPLGSQRFLARKYDDVWCVGSSEGLFWLQDNVWEPFRPQGWPGGPAQGLLSDGRGRILAWSVREGTIGGTIAIYDNGNWSTIEAPRAEQCAGGGIRADGAAVLVGHQHLIIAKPPQNTAVSADQLVERSVTLPLGGNQSINVPCLTLPQADGTEKKVVFSFGREIVSGMPSVTRNGNVLFTVPPLEDGARGLIRVSAEGSPEWIDFTPEFPHEFILPTSNDGFNLIGTELGIYTLAKNAKTPEKVAEPEEVIGGDFFDRCDDRGRIYVLRTNTWLMFSPFNKPQPRTELRELARRGTHNPMLSSHFAAVDSHDALWYTSSGGAVMKQAANESEPQSQDDRLVGAVTLWPGRNGSMLFGLPEGAALVHGKNEVLVDQSLLQLAEKNFDALLAAAPQLTRDERRGFLRGNQMSPRVAPPWLAIGKSLWISDGAGVYRLRKIEENGALRVDAQAITSGNYRMFGPLASGELFLSPFDPRELGRLQNWLAVSDPDGKAELKPLVISGKDPANPSVQAPNMSLGDWWVDAQKTLWLYGAATNSFRITAPDQWTRVNSVGMAQFETTDGDIWAYRSDDNLAGYEVIGAKTRRSCVPTYLHHATPLFAEANRVACLTPTGTAWLHFDRDRPADDAFGARQHVRWANWPVAYIGHVGRKVYLVTREIGIHNLVTFEMSP